MRIVVAKTSAVYGARLLAALRDLEAETHLVLSQWAIIAPPAPAFYSNPKSIDDLVDIGWPHTGPVWAGIAKDQALERSARIQPGARIVSEGGDE
jgi:hypothetical protein